MTEKAKSELTGLALLIAVFVVITWLGFLVWLAIQASDTVSDLVWSRLLVLLSSLEAVAFGAAGALFGTQIQRQRIADAKERAERAEGEAAAEKETSSKGRALAAVVKSEAERRPTATGAEGLSAGAQTPGDTALKLARDLLPD